VFTNKGAVDEAEPARRRGPGQSLGPHFCGGNLLFIFPNVAPDTLWLYFRKRYLPPDMPPINRHESRSTGTCRINVLSED
jgi:hypothetical protein